jgi:hypothetical protein
MLSTPIPKFSERWGDDAGPPALLSLRDVYQTTANQERELREIAARMGCEIVKVYKDHGISGAKGRDERPALDRLCRDAARREFDMVMAWSVDRLGRSLQDLVGFLSELHALKIDQDSAIAHRCPNEAAGFSRLRRIDRLCHHASFTLSQAPREDVLERWPDPANPPRAVQPTTAAAENQCRRWLVAMMRENPDRPTPKAAVREEALLKFRGLGKRGFGRAWDAAIREANAPKWRVPGRRI